MMKKSISNFLLGLLAGAAAGAIVGILYAPDKGSATRKNIRKKVRDFSDQYGLGFGELLDDMQVETEPATREKPKAPGKKRGPKTPKNAPVAKRKYTRKPKTVEE